MEESKQAGDYYYEAIAEPATGTGRAQWTARLPPPKRGMIKRAIFVDILVALKMIRNKDDGFPLQDFQPSEGHIDHRCAWFIAGPEAIRVSPVNIYNLYFFFLGSALCWVTVDATRD